MVTLSTLIILGLTDNFHYVLLLEDETTFLCFTPSFPSSSPVRDNYTTNPRAELRDRTLSWSICLQQNHLPSSWLLSRMDE